jgi:hypothetical protein
MVIELLTKDKQSCGFYDNGMDSGFRAESANCRTSFAAQPFKTLSREKG